MSMGPPVIPIPAPEEPDEPGTITEAPLALDTTDCLMIVRDPSPGFVGKRCSLSHTPVRIGRGRNCDIVLEGDALSRRHAQLEHRDGAWHIVAAAGTTGTFCNDELVEGERALRPGDRVSIGATIFKLLSGPDVEVQYSVELSRLCFEDGLTQIPNARAFDEAIVREVRASRWNAGALSILLVDIDRFARINETSGRLAGDFVLQSLARLVRGHVRGRDTVARCGEDELALLLPGTSIDAAVTLGETLRQTVSDHHFEFQSNRIAVTISVGAAQLRDGERTGSNLVERATEQLARAKREGRDRVRG
ncbi:diguanylate cyclase (GGDEF domain) with PAS/PAC sensor [Minicystis rosea]|nr:diguanylate cyclase (GGDEF domain) with PAS/PAC sensor [Minicystis rosea]